MMMVVELRITNETRIPLFRYGTSTEICPGLTSTFCHIGPQLPATLEYVIAVHSEGMPLIMIMLRSQQVPRESGACQGRKE